MDTKKNDPVTKMLNEATKAIQTAQQQTKDALLNSQE
jgi:hypothetical protein